MGQVLRGRPAAKNVDFTLWNEYQICKQFGWSLEYLRSQPAEDVEIFMAFMNEERQAERANQKKK